MKRFYLFLMLWFVLSMIGFWSLPVLGLAEVFYASPSGGSGSGNSCPKETPCSLTNALKRADTGGDVVKIMDGVYPGTWTTMNNGSSPTNRITIEAVNRHKAILEFNGADNKGDATGDAFSIHHDNLIIRGIQLDCTAKNGNNAWDCYSINGVRAGSMVSNVLTEDVYVHDSGHMLVGCFSAENIEIRNSTFDNSGIDSHFGEAIYASSSTKDHPCHNAKFHHNFFSRFRANQIDMKSQTRNVHVDNNIWMDKKQHITATTSSDGDVRTGRRDPQPPGTTAAGNYYRNNITLRARDMYFYSSDDGHRLDLIGNVISIWKNVKGNDLKLNNNDTITQAVSQNNIVCGAETPVIEGVDRTHGGTPNKLNRPTSECSARIEQIIGKPSVSSCEIGNVDDKTVVVNIQSDVHPPISSVGAVGDIQITYDDVGQTENAVVLHNGLQARITMSSAPSNEKVAVKLSVPEGVIKNSAFIGGKTCGTTSFNATTTHGSLTLGQGICGGNNQQVNVVCQNNVKSEGIPSNPSSPKVFKIMYARVGFVL